jgi:hypothetical protein
MPLSLARRIVKTGLALLLLGVATVAGIALGTDPLTRSATVEVMRFTGFVAAGVGLLLVWIGWRALRLARPANTIARWIVPHDQWQRYVAACRMREAMPGALPGVVPLDLPVPAAGIEVLALKRGFRVGDSFHEMGTIGCEVMDMRVVDSPAHLFEFNMRYSTGRYSSVTQGVRIPIALDAQALANQVEDYWVKREPLQTMSVEQLRARGRKAAWMAWSGLAALLASIAMFASVNPPGWMAVLPIGSGCAAGVGFARWLNARNVRWRREGK